MSKGKAAAALARCRHLVACALVLLAAALAAPALAVSQPEGPIYGVELQGVVTSVSIDYLQRALRVAETSEATALIITMSGEGGVLRDARPFANRLANARVPVVVYVAPPGTDSGAIGALFLSAAHVSAMAPNTSFGSPYPLTQVDSALSEQTRDLIFDSVTSQIRQWNSSRNRNTDWIDRAVREGAVLTNEQAIGLQPPAIDLVAADRQQLMTLLQGRTVTLADGRSRMLDTLSREVTAIRPSLWEGLRLILADPTVAFVLLVLGSLAIYLEIASPGTSIFAGLGLVMLAGALLGLVVLPLNLWALALVVLAFALMAADLFVTSHGALTIGGLALLVVGALNLIDSLQAPGVGVAGWSVGAVALALGSIAGIGLWLAIRSRSRPVTTGQAALIGRVAEARTRLDPEGMVFVEGALWQAISETGTVEPGEWVRIVAMHNLRLIVQPIDADEPAD